jgi:citrate synthase
LEKNNAATTNKTQNQNANKTKDFADAAYLLLHGELPTKIQKRKFEVKIREAGI